MCKGLEGMKEDARIEERERLIMNALRKGKTPEEVSDLLDVSLEEVEAIAKSGLYKA